jgi:capsular exopolysaccharide synthesis family protein
LVNLAYICAQGGYTTLMIDADLRRPRLHTFFDINNSVGLTNYLTTELMLEDVILQTPVDNLYFMPSGILPADAAGILNSRRMSELIQDVKQRFDLVLVDSPPILGVSDASVLASEVDLTMLVVQHRKLPRNMLLRVKQAVENVGGNTSSAWCSTTWMSAATANTSITPATTPTTLLPRQSRKQAIRITVNGAAGGATPFGTMKRVKLLRAGKQRQYDLTQLQNMQHPLDPGDTIEVPQKRPFE